MQKKEKSHGASKIVKRHLARLRIKPLLILLVAACILLFAGCSSTGAAPNNTPAPPSTPTTSVRTSYPLTVTDFLGRTVTLNQKPLKIVTVHPTATETLYRVGG